MAERKIGNIAMGIAFMLFMFSFFFAFMQEAENSYNVSNVVSSDVLSIYSNASKTYSDSQKDLETVTHNASTFTVQSNTIVDTRGTGQANIISSKNPSVIMDAVTKAGTVLAINPIITLLIGFVVILTGVTLFVRFLRPGGA